MTKKTDRGIVIVTDNRLIKKPYGTIFLSSLPETIKYFGEMEGIEKKSEDFLYSASW